MFQRIALLKTLPFANARAATKVARRWQDAAAHFPELRGDIIELGGVLAAQPVDGIDPMQIAYEAGRRDFALQLAAMMNLSVSELNSLMEDPDA